MTRAPNTPEAYLPYAMPSGVAARYLGIGETMFLELVESGTLPPPVALGARRVWIRANLEAALDALQSESSAPQKANSWDDAA